MFDFVLAFEHEIYIYIYIYTYRIWCRGKYNKILSNVCFSELNLPSVKNDHCEGEQPSNEHCHYANKIIAVCMA